MTFCVCVCECVREREETYWWWYCGYMPNDTNFRVKMRGTFKEYIHVRWIRICDKKLHSWSQYGGQKKKKNLYGHKTCKFALAIEYNIHYDKNINIIKIWFLNIKEKGITGMNLRLITMALHRATLHPIHVVQFYNTEYPLLPCKPCKS